MAVPLAASVPRSATACVHLPMEQYPKTFQSATAMFSGFGDIARIDMTLGLSTGRILVTFFDVRATERVLSDFKGTAELFPPAVHDFRAVSVAVSAFTGLPATFGGFHTFGEIAGVSISGEDMVVEFYDMRAAQQAVFSMPGARPRRPTAVSSADYNKAFLQQVLSPEAVEALSEDSSSQVAVQERAGIPDRSLGGAPGLEVGADPKAAAPEAAAAKVPRDKGSREPISRQKLSMFDIDADKIKGGFDPRTTVMVRNLSKACTREIFVDLLVDCGLDTRYDFLYTPFDKRRNVPCGFAFVNFLTPQDVLVLFESMQNPALLSSSSLGKVQSTVLPAVSYGRLQGQEQLMAHFSSSAVMRENDSRKRPMFYNGDENEGGACERQEEADKPLVSEPQLHSAPLKVNIPMQPRHTVFLSQEVDLDIAPCYVSLPGCTAPASKDSDPYSLPIFGKEDLGFGLGADNTLLLSNAFGA